MNQSKLSLLVVTIFMLFGHLGYSQFSCDDGCDNYPSVLNSQERLNELLPLGVSAYNDYLINFHSLILELAYLECEYRCREGEWISTTCQQRYNQLYETYVSSYNGTNFYNGLHESLLRYLNILFNCDDIQING